MTDGQFLGRAGPSDVGSRVFHDRGGPGLELSGGVVATLHGYRQVGPGDLEAGGLLLGRWLPAARAVVDLATAPQPEDLRRRFRFVRSDAAHRRIAEKARSRSSQAWSLLGTWHTHAEGEPEPTESDLRAWRRAVREDVGSGDRLFFLIVGTERDRVWVVVRDGATRELESSASG